MKLVIELDLEPVEGDKRAMAQTLRDLLPHIIDYPHSDLRVAAPTPFGKVRRLFMQGVDGLKYPEPHLPGLPTAVHIEVSDAPMPVLVISEEEVAETAMITGFYEGAQN